jgi:hypothetical protein
MKWRDIVKSCITVVQEKTCQKLIIPVHERLAAILKETAQISPSAKPVNGKRPNRAKPA